MMVALAEIGHPRFIENNRNFKKLSLYIILIIKCYLLKIKTGGP